MKIALKSEVISESYSRYLKRFSSNEYYKGLKSKFSTTEHHFRNLIIRNLIFNDKDTIWSSYYTLFTSDIWMMLSKRFEKIRRNVKNSHRKGKGHLKIAKDAEMIHHEQ